MIRLEYDPIVHEWTGELSPRLRALTALESHGGSMTAAAAALGVSQSSMSRRLHALEAQMGVPLLIKDGRKVRLTPAALSLVADIRAPLAALEHAVERAVDAGDGSTGSVRFGFPLTMGSGEVPELLAAFHHRNPGIRLELKQAHGAQLVADLRSGELDLAITIPLAHEVEHAMVGSQEIVVAVPENHWSARRSSVALAELSGEDFIANPETYHLRRATQEWCAAAGYTPRVAIEITEFATAREFVERGLGIALLPRAGRPIAGVAEVPVAPETLRRDIGLAWASTIRTPAVERLSRFLRENLPVRPPA